MSYVPPDLRRWVVERAGECCEYCRIGQADSASGFHIEHIIAVSHGGRTSPENLALSSAPCNLHKGSNIAAADPETGDPTFLFHPRRHHWDQHFRLENGHIMPLTPEGRVTVFLLRLNNPERVDQRMMLIPLGRYPCQSPD